jgi:hypothetical protein
LTDTCTIHGRYWAFIGIQGEIAWVVGSPSRRRAGFVALRRVVTRPVSLLGSPRTRPFRLGTDREALGG